MDSPIIDTSHLDDESGFIPEITSWEVECEPVPKAYDFKFGVNFMNQLISVSKLNYYLGSTIDETATRDSLLEESISKKSIVSNSKKVKARVGSGNVPLKNRKGLLKKSNNEETGEESTTINKDSEVGVVGSNKRKRRTTYGSKSPFPRQAVNKKRNKNTAKEEKSTEAEEDFKGNRTKKSNKNNKTNHDDNPWVIGNSVMSSTEKSKRDSKLSKKGGSVVRKQQQRNRGNKVDSFKNKGKVKSL